jgi:hypothetical protein
MLHRHRTHHTHHIVMVRLAHRRNRNIYSLHITHGLKARNETKKKKANAKIITTTTTPNENFTFRNHQTINNIY